MAILRIVWAPDPVLKVKCTKVAEIDDDLRQLMDDMLETMYNAPGVGLAAPQVGVARRVRGEAAYTFHDDEALARFKVQAQEIQEGWGHHAYLANSS